MEASPQRKTHIPKPNVNAIALGEFGVVVLFIAPSSKQRAAIHPLSVDLLVFLRTDSYKTNKISFAVAMILPLFSICLGSFRD